MGRPWTKMSEEYVSIEVHNEFAKRIEAEDERQNRRIAKLEDAVGQMSELTASVRELATNMANMAKEQTKMSDRLEVIENRPAQNWDKLVWAIAGALIAGIIGYVLATMGI